MMEDISKKIELLREDDDTKEILEFLIGLPKLDFQLYGQFFMDIYKSKVQEGSGTSKAIIDNEKRKIMAQVHHQITKHKQKVVTLENEKLSLEQNAKEAKRLEEKAKIDLQRELALRETTIAGKIQTAVIEKEKAMKREAETKISALEKDKYIQSEKVSSLKSELEKEKANKDLEIMKKTKEGIERKDLIWKGLVSEKENTIFRLQKEKDSLQNKIEDYFVKDNSEKANKSHEILAKLGGIEKVIIKPVNSSQIGQKGEQYVLQALKTAFPNNFRIYETKTHHCGDIVFNIENTNKWIMFEVKDVETSNIKNHKQGNDLKKFYEDSKANKLGFKFDAAVLVSLNCIVDPTIKNLEPFVKDGKPYMYVDNARNDSADPISLFRAIVGMMKFMVNHCMDNKVENFGVKIQKYMEQTRKMYTFYEDMVKNHKASGKNLEKMKESLDGHFKDLETDNAKNEGGCKRNDVDAVESQPKYQKTESISSFFKS